ncbi:MAG: ATP-dependent helicase, partial [Lachnospiraceae bacterium]|nr:ATP-dependent helicase [Lachnospiraceae bacterium]
CRKNKKVDFDDMQIMCCDILRDNETLLLQYRTLYKYYLIDEFQDINDIQYEIIRLLAGDDKNVFAVGDDDQAIYGFRGSDPMYMQRFITDYSEINKPVKVINLIKNYRCPECVIDAADRLILNNNNRILKIQKAGKKDKKDGSVTVHISENALTEADYVIDVIKSEYFNYFLSNDDLMHKKTDVMSGDNGLTFAVLYRTARCADILEERFSKEGILYKRYKEKSGYYDAEWIKDITAYLRYAVYDEEKYIYRVLNRPDREILRDDTEKINDLMSKTGIIRDMSPYAAVIYILKALNYEEYYYKCKSKAGLSIEKAADELNEFINISRNYKSISEWLNNRDNDSVNDVKCSYNHDFFFPVIH